MHPRPTETADIAVIGAGILGTATALELSHRHPDAKIALVEKEETLAAHQTGHNSGVIHSGIYYAPTSLKANLCRKGLRRTKEFARAHGVPYQETGKLLVATDEVEAVRMRALAERAADNGLTVDLLSRRELREREPRVHGVGAIHIAETAIVDYARITTALARAFQDRGGLILPSTHVRDVRETATDLTLATGNMFVRADRAVFCAGLQADRLARAVGLGQDLQIIPFRGEYYTVHPRLRSLVNHLIYPIPDPDLPFLGVHLSPTVHGELTVGPNAVLGLAREKYTKGGLDLADLRQMLTFPGLWRVARTHFATGIKELYASAVKRGYLSAVRAYCPELQAHDLLPRPAGIRAQAVSRDGTLIHDFHIESTARTLHVLNAPSPAATSALPIADHIADRFAAPTPDG